MTGVRPVDALTLAGPPGNIRGAIALDIADPEMVPIAINFEKQPGIFRGVLRPLAAGVCEIHLRLPDATLPGTYSGEVTIKEKPRAIVVQVDAYLRVRTQPRQTLMTIEASSSKPFNLTLSNNGNVAVDVPKAAAFDLDDDDSQDQALGRSLRAVLARGELRSEKFFEELRLAHGGEGRITVRAGSGSLRPGETREITAVLEVPDTVKAGRSYTGSWNIGPVAHVIVANVQTSSRPNNPVRAAT